ncbi:hypothetical protein SPSYN_01515 [Sporotomaculum syntrophicum]|uniref:Uncharacterized protein n=1 Tax=Sporotomaculum syntrophicum TaxID=182264 RepID=A0A9D3AZ09_9FIRM|nr:DUF2889 domain-containing protein [Sporotomaculum syntrophicum]KAF1085379.1 hypothetical protein SPSYN_01515 [Sporotomaculum syntrophicum]
MINILQRHWHTSVRLNPPTSASAVNLNDTAAEIGAGQQTNIGQLQAETIYCGTDCEVGARLRVDPISFKIMEATWETYSLPVTITDIPGLQGVEAYFNSGPAISEAVAHLGSLSRALFKETVRGVIQSETFLLSERGYASAADYNKYWDEFYLNTCRYYSNLDRITKVWDYSDYTRTNVLFNRFVSQSVYELLGGGYRVIATFSDSYHEMSVELETDSNLLITKSDGVLLRAPDDVCMEANVFLKQLQGFDANNPVKKQIALVLGRGDGCVHLIDTAYEALIAVNIAVSRQNRQSTT